MWTPAARAELARESLPYATCLSDAEWTVLAPLLPAPSSTGRPWRWPVRAILDGILYVLRTGWAWRYLPLDFPPWSTVHRWFLRALVQPSLPIPVKLPPGYIGRDRVFPSLTRKGSYDQAHSRRGVCRGAHFPCLRSGLRDTDQHDGRCATWRARRCHAPAWFDR